MRFLATLVALVIWLVPLVAQEPPRFEVASVKPSNPDSDPGPFGTGAIYLSPEGDVRFTRADLVTLIAGVFGIERDLFNRLDFGGRKFFEVFNTHFDIEGKGGSGTSQERLHTLLVERFGLKTHKEVRHIPVYALRVKTPGRFGPYLKPSTDDCRPFIGRRKEAPAVCMEGRDEWRFGARLTRYAGPIDELALRFGGVVGMPIVDETGLQGFYQWELAYDPSRTPKSDVPNIFTALEDQLGLKLEKTIGPWEVFVVDNIQMPTPN
jgi:uncharacterized protein (TIGR03435 family)